MQRQNNQQQHRTRHLAWILSLLLFLSPLLTQAQWANPTAPSNTSNVEMPCHQAVSSNPQNENCNHCSDTQQSLTCDCCETAVPLSLSMGQGTFTPVLFHTELQILPYDLEFPDPPPGSLYRPPIQRLI
ncbi:MAG: hypothetical protein ABFS39_16800 [Pseudomonadota bacterium]